MAASDEIRVHPDNVPAFSLFVSLMTQWRMGPAGPIGLDYTAIPVVMDLRRMPADERGDVFDDLRVMESAALETLRSKK